MPKKKAKGGALSGDTKPQVMRTTEEKIYDGQPPPETDTSSGQKKWNEAVQKDMLDGNMAMDAEQVLKDATLTGAIRSQEWPPAGTPDAEGNIKDEEVWTAGIGSKAIDEQTIKYDRAPNEWVRSRSGAFIVMGRGRGFGAPTDGSGGRGYTDSAELRLIAGLGSNVLGKKTWFGLKRSKKKYIQMGASPASTAAQFVVSQKSRPDNDCGIVDGSAGKAAWRSSLWGNADEIRFRARGSIKLVTGGFDGLKGAGFGGERLSAGGSNETIQGVELIGGNNDMREWHFSADKLFYTQKKLQPIVKGNHLVNGLRELQTNLQDQNIALIWLTYIVILLQFHFTIHIHTNMGGPTIPAPDQLVVPAECSFLMTKVGFPLIDQLIKGGFWALNYLEPSGNHWICSAFNKTN